LIGVRKERIRDGGRTTETIPSSWVFLANSAARSTKLAFFKLAKKHHPDEKAPGKSIDAQDFPKASLQKSILRGDFELITMTKQEPD
jgi:hypothetical protein